MCNFTVGVNSLFHYLTSPCNLRPPTLHQSPIAFFDLKSQKIDCNLLICSLIGILSVLPSHSTFESRLSLWGLTALSTAILWLDTNLIWSCTYLDPPRIPLKKGDFERNLIPPLLRGDRILRGLIKNWYQGVSDWKITPISQPPTMSIVLLNAAIVRISGKLPLQSVPVVSFVVPITATVGLVGYFWFQNGQQAVNQLPSQSINPRPGRSNLPAIWSFSHCFRCAWQININLSSGRNQVLRNLFFLLLLACCNASFREKNRWRRTRG